MEKMCEVDLVPVTNRVESLLSQRGLEAQLEGKILQLWVDYQIAGSKKTPTTIH